MLFTPDSGLGSTYPSVGQVVGLLADRLRLKGALRDGWEARCYKTAQRFFAGEPVSAEAMQEVVDALLGTLVPERGLPECLGGGGLTAHQRVRGLILQQLEAYASHTAAASGSFPLLDPDLAAYPYLRLLVLDLAIRWGAYQCLRAIAGAIPEQRPCWLGRSALAARIEERRKALGLTLEQLASRCAPDSEGGVSVNTVKKWRDGAVPEDRHLVPLARALRGEDTPALVEVELRLAAASQALLCDLGRADPWWLDDLLAGFEATSRLVLAEFQTLPAAPAARQVLLDTVALGALSRAGPRICTMLALRALGVLREEAHYDFVALGGPWTERINHWAKIVGTGQAARAEMARELGLDETKANELLLAALRSQMQLSDLDGPAPTYVYRISGPPGFSAANRRAQAQQAASVGNHAVAIAHARRAVELDPTSGESHAMLASMLGELALVERQLAGRSDLFEEALGEAHIAAQLLPDQRQPVNEVAIILANAGQHAEAEAAYERAAPLCEKWAHHHLGRGRNYLALGRFEDAARAYQRAIELDPRDVESTARLAALLMKLGRKADANKLATRVRHLRGRGIEGEEWEALVRPWDSGGL